MSKLVYSIITIYIQTYRDMQPLFLKIAVLLALFTLRECYYVIFFDLNNATDFFFKINSLSSCYTSSSYRLKVFETDRVLGIFSSICCRKNIVSLTTVILQRKLHIGGYI